VIKEPSQTYKGTCVEVKDLTASLKAQMLALFKANYQNVDTEHFWNDLAQKSHVILVYDPDGQFRGFSTAVVWRYQFENKPVRLLFSGDTIVDPAAWGHMALPITWMRFAGTIWSMEPQTRLFWLLTSKGHRTYRFMSLFFENFLPHWEKDDRECEDHLLAKSIGNHYFTEHFEPDTELITYAGTKYTVNSKLAKIPAKDVNRPDVSYFLSRNKNYMLGDELLCLGELHANNIRLGLRRYFISGLDKTSP
tara:strand:+ start:42517 stop:43266 length:750 start_codon:yes stop_codon:yes gene_type:complete